jgi:uncharacterized protein (DUF1778 family)
MNTEHKIKDEPADYALSARCGKEINDLVEKARIVDNRTRTSFIKQACKKYAKEVLQEE